MRAVVLRSHGGPECLVIEEVPEPVVGPEEVLVDVAATALNRADLLQVMGLYPNPRPAELEIPGLEFAGTVVSVGARVGLWNFFEVNWRLAFDRAAAYGMRLAIPAGSALRFEPNVPTDAPLVPIGGARIAIGFAGLVDGPLDAPGAKDAALARAAAQGYLGAVAP